MRIVLEDMMGNTKKKHHTSPEPVINHLPLDGLAVKILFLARDVVGSHDTSLHSGTNATAEHTAECVEASLVSSRYHFAHVHH